jgi:anionic cell wall polymer biosynthesis LytR-Cps2A-Psr (LCP) family protein
MDGETTELYVRARHSDVQGDFGRSQRQQQILLLLKQKLQEKVDQGDFNLAGIVAQDMKHEAQMDLSLPDILGLARSVLGLQSSQIHRWVLTNTSGYDTERTITMPNGTPNDVLIPNWNKILPLFACVDSTRAAGGCPGL